jgi:hypothetical protein
MPTRYAPLADAPGLFFDFAYWDLNQEKWLVFLHRYGTLGPDPERDRFSRFCDEVRRAKRVLKLFGAATVEPEPNVRAIAEVFEQDGVLEDRPRWAAKVKLEDAKAAALQEVRMVTEDMLKEWTFPAPYQRDLDQPFSRSWGFGSLLGALWLQFYFLMTSDKVRYCQGPGCSNPIANEDPGAPLPEGEGKRKKSDVRH